MFLLSLSKDTPSILAGNVAVQKHGTGKLVLVLSKILSTPTLDSLHDMTTATNLFPSLLYLALPQSGRSLFLSGTISLCS